MTYVGDLMILSSVCVQSFPDLPISILHSRVCFSAYEGISSLPYIANSLTMPSLGY